MAKNNKKRRKSTNQKQSVTAHTHKTRKRHLSKRRIVKWASLVIVIVMIISVFAGFFVAKF